MKMLKLTIDGREYIIRQAFPLRAVKPDAPVLCVVSYLPNSSAVELVRLAVESIRKYTDSPYSLWIVDNNSSEEHKAWLRKQVDITLVEICTPAKEQGSYANALALEACLRLLPAETRFFMSLHQDILVCKSGWLRSLLSKFTGNVMAVGVREDRARVPEGILHVLGYIVNLSTFRVLGLTYFPDLPRHDVGDAAIVGLLEAGYAYHASRNTIHDEVLAATVPAPYGTVGFDRSVNDDGDVFFMHLGRGSLKSDAGFAQKEKQSFELWRDFAFRELGLPRHACVPVYPRQKPVMTTFRRLHVDAFQSGAYWTGRVLDVGGKKENKRGEFRPPKAVAWEYLNIDEATDPDYVGSVESIPVPDASFDIVLLAEVVEHLENPELALQECARVLRPGGMMYILSPFLYPIHADPDDFQRWLPDKYASVLEKTGIRMTSISHMGRMGGVVYDLFRIYASNTRQVGSPLTKKFILKILLPLTNVFLLRGERRACLGTPPVITGGFYIEGVKPCFQDRIL